MGEGVALGAADVGADGLRFVHYNTTVGRTNRLAAACLPASAYGPDVVYRVEVLDSLALSIAVDSWLYDPPFQTPGVYLFAGGCAAEALVGCGQSYSFAGFGLGFATLYRDLTPGLYFVVIDSGAMAWGGLPQQGNFQVEFSFALPPVPEDCANDRDDNGNGFVDCHDPMCFEDVICTEGRTGQSCADALRIAGGAALAPGATYTVRNTTVGRTNDFAAPCSLDSRFAPDLVYGFTLAEPATVTARVAFETLMPPALSLLDDGCDPDAPVACETGRGTSAQAAVIAEELAPGTYYLVVDAADDVFGWNAADFTLTVAVDVP